MKKNLAPAPHCGKKRFFFKNISSGSSFSYQNLALSAKFLYWDNFNSIESHFELWRTLTFVVRGILEIKTPDLAILPVPGDWLWWHNYSTLKTCIQSYIRQVICTNWYILFCKCILKSLIMAIEWKKHPNYPIYLDRGNWSDHTERVQHVRAASVDFTWELRLKEVWVILVDAKESVQE